MSLGPGENVGEMVIVTVEAAHMPKCPIDEAAYDRHYAFNQGTDDQLEIVPEWQEIRIQPGLSETDVYRLLPSSRDFEYSGYLTRSRVRYHQADASSAGMWMSKPCTFHSHPTQNPHLADIPSLQDIYSFLNYRHLRTITVGATKLWVWDKTKATVGTIRKLGCWVEANHFRVVTRLMQEDFAAWPDRYVQTVMKELGWVWPNTLEELDAQWPSILRNKFKIKVRLFARDPGVQPR